MFIVRPVIGIASSSSFPSSADVFRASGVWAAERHFPHCGIYANAGSFMSVISDTMVSLSIMGGGGHLLSGLPSFFALYGIDIQVSLQR